MIVAFHNCEQLTEIKLKLLRLIFNTNCQDFCETKSTSASCRKTRFVSRKCNSHLRFITQLRLPWCSRMDQVHHFWDWDSFSPHKKESQSRNKSQVRMIHKRLFTKQKRKSWKKYENYQRKKWLTPSFLLTISLSVKGPYMSKQDPLHTERKSKRMLKSAFTILG